MKRYEYDNGALLYIRTLFKSDTAAYFLLADGRVAFCDLTPPTYAEYGQKPYAPVIYDGDKALTVLRTIADNMSYETDEDFLLDIADAIACGEDLSEYAE